MALGGMFGQATDYIIGSAARSVLAARLAPYGTMLKFSIDSSTKSIYLEVLLKGESEPIHVTLRGYEFTGDGKGGTLLSVREATASREWLGVLLNEFVVGQTVALPTKFVPLIKLLT